MPASSQNPDNSPIDRDHLARMTLGDAALAREVLTMFHGQSARLMDQLAALPTHAVDLAHALKGSALGIGAHRVSDAAEAVCVAALAGDELADSVAVLRDTVESARAQIVEILARG